MFFCYKCEIEATREVILEAHFERKHKLNKDIHQVPGKLYCEVCEKTFSYRFLLKHHTCIPLSKYACQECEFMSITLVEHLTHVGKSHVKQVDDREKSETAKCDHCDYTSSNVENMNSHVQFEHKTPKVDIEKRDQVNIMCDKCEYKCRLNIQLKKHKETVHSNHHVADSKYKCDTCSFEAEYLLHMWDHRQSKHPDHTPQF